MLKKFENSCGTTPETTHSFPKLQKLKSSDTIDKSSTGATSQSSTLTQIRNFIMASIGGFDRPPQRDSWFAPMSIDLFLKVLNVTFFHPFVAWMIPLCFRAEHMDWDKIPMQVSIYYAWAITGWWILGEINKRVAFGLPREVNLEDEVIVITGGASGLGLLIAEVYGMRGASVAVLDVRDLENGEARGVTHYKCDVTDKEQLARVSRQIEEDVRPALANPPPSVHVNR